MIGRDGGSLLARSDHFWQPISVQADLFRQPKVVGRWTTFGKVGPLLAAHFSPGGPFLATKSGPPGPLLGRTGFAGTGHYFL